MAHAALVVLATAALSGTGPRLEYEPAGADGAAGRFVVRGLTDPGRAGTLTVRTAAGPGLLGTTGVTGGVLWFRPRFPVAFDVPHTVTHTPAVGPGRTITVTRARPAAPRTTLTAVTPTGPAVPENLLRVTLHFSAPMRRGEAARRVRLLKADGAAVELPFLDLDEELWDPAGTRLTLLVDPGRVKRGLKPRADAGPVFEAGETYTLDVDKDWPDAAGRPLAAGVRKAYTATAAATARLDPAAWTLTPPADPAGALGVRFPAALDHSLASRCLTVVDANGATIPGRVEVLDAERHWQFTPAAPWPPGAYRLRVDAALEDVAGNRADRVFDAPEGDDPGPPPTRERAFRVPAGR